MLQGSIMQMKALYGWDVDGNGSVDTYNAVTPAPLVGNQGIWQNLVAVSLKNLMHQRERENQYQNLLPMERLMIGFQESYV
jgi:hypothetical protein